MVHVAEVNVRGFHSQAYEPISKANVNPLNGTMAHAQLLDRNDTAVSSVSFSNIGKEAPHVTPPRSEAKWGVPQEMFASVEQFRDLASTAISAYSASLAGQSASVNLHTR